MNDNRSIGARKDFETLFTPFQIGSHEVKNRIVSTAHAMGWDPGLLTERHVEYLERKAAGGAGLIMTFGSASVYKHSSASYGSISLWDPENEPALTDLANRVHAHGAKIITQATHMGRRGDSSVSGQPLQAPSAIPEGVHREIPHVLRQDEIPPIVEAFADAAARLERCGWDGIELEAFSGHLIEQFWSPAINKRTDRYGGDLTGRMRFSVEVIEAVAAAVSDDFLIVLRMTGDPMTDDLGLDRDDLLEIALRLEKLGHIDLFHISGGNAATYAGQSAVVPGDTYPSGVFNQAANRMKAHLSTPVLVAGRNLEPSQAEEALQQDDADLIGMTRAIIADPDLPRKAEEGRTSQIRPAIALTEDTIGRLYSGKPVVSAVNPAVADASLDEFEEAENKRRVVVVGAGPAGMEAARVASIRGHEVTLLEASEQFGGQVATGAVATERPHYGKHIQWLGREFERYHVDMRLNMKADAEKVMNLNPDVVVIATGSTAEIPSEVESIKTRCTTDVEILNGNVSISTDSRVLVYDRESKFRGASIAKYAAEAGATKVEIVSPLWSVSEDLDEIQKPEMYRLLAENNVIRTANVRLAGEQDGYLLLEDVWSGEKRRVDDIDLAVFVGFQEAEDSLYHQIKKTAPEIDVQLIGDAIAPRRMSDAISEGVRTGSKL